MTIGIPKALIYYQHGILWKSFFKELGCDVVISDNTNETIFQDGARDSVSECCLPAKAYLGHIHSLRNRCDYILSPYAIRKTGGDDVCTRFWGLGDVLRHTCPGIKLLECDMSGGAAEYKSFRHIGKLLGKSHGLTRHAYEVAVEAQSLYNKELRDRQSSLLSSDGLKILLAGRSYVMHDPYISGSLLNILSELGCIVFFSDRFDRKDVMRYSLGVSPRLYWAASREAVGAIAARKQYIDGVLMLTVFPCAPDALACEMAIRVINDIPIAQITLDGLRGEAGLQTRIESFIDILTERKANNAQRQSDNLISSHG